MEITKEAYVASLSLKIHQKLTAESDVIQSLKFIRVWSQEAGIS